VIHELTLRKYASGIAARSKTRDTRIRWPYRARGCPRWMKSFQLAPTGKFDYNIETKSFCGQAQYTPLAGAVRQAGAEGDPQVQAGPADHSAIFRLPDAAGHAETRAEDPVVGAHGEGPARVRRHRGRSRKGRDHLPRISPCDGRQGAAGRTAAGLQVVPWTADTPEDWEMLIQAKVDAIISDDPAELIAYLKKRRPEVGPGMPGPYLASSASWILYFVFRNWDRFSHNVVRAGRSLQHRVQLGMLPG